jgi:DNA-binding CsgD family transcriptional regulator
MQNDNSRFNFNIDNKTFEEAKEESLTKKEREVLICTALGDSNEAISKKLKISESTLKNHKTKIFKKLHVSNTAEAVFYASKQNLI